MSDAVDVVRDAASEVTGYLVDHPNAAAAAHRLASAIAAVQAAPAGDAGLREALTEGRRAVERYSTGPAHGREMWRGWLRSRAIDLWDMLDTAALAANPTTAPDADRNVEWIPAPLPVGSPYTPEQADRVLAIGRAVWAAPDAEVARLVADIRGSIEAHCDPDCHEAIAQMVERFVPRLPVATASTGPTGLDVERLTRAIVNTSVAVGLRDLKPTIREEAEMAVSEYARLRPTPPLQPETGE